MTLVQYVQTAKGCCGGVKKEIKTIYVVTIPIVPCEGSGCFCGSAIPTTIKLGRVACGVLSSGSSGGTNGAEAKDSLFVGTMYASGVAVLSRKLLSYREVGTYVVFI